MYSNIPYPLHWADQQEKICCPLSSQISTNKSQRSVKLEQILIRYWSLLKLGKLTLFRVITLSISYDFCMTMKVMSLSVIFFMFRLIQNYKVEKEAFSYSQDIYDHVEREKENILVDDGDVSIRVIARALKELWLNSGVVLTSQRRRSKGGVRERGFVNLKRNSVSPTEASQPGVIEMCDLPSITYDGWQSAVNSDSSVSFLRVESLLYDGHRVATEVNFQYNEERELTVWLKLNERTVTLNDFTGFKFALRKRKLLDNVHFVLNFVEKSSFCLGFKSDLCADTPISPELYIKHEVQDLREELEISEVRIFSSGCLVLRNNAMGDSCVNCAQANYQLGRIKGRRESTGVPNPKCNNRYLSRAEILSRLKQEKKKELTAKGLWQNFRKK